MDQQSLRELENRCIQDQPPACTAACPLHLDARRFVHLVSRGRWEEAWGVLGKTLPLPGILARICDAPCRQSCKRRDVGESIQIGDLERACVKTPAPARHIRPLGKKDKRVAIVGSGLSGLTVAWDLARKGFKITVLEPGERLGEPLWAWGEKQLPREVIQAETAVLINLGVHVAVGVPADAPDFPDRLLSEFDAVYVGLDAIDGGPWAHQPTVKDRAPTEPRTQAVEDMPGLFAGGQPHDGVRSPVWQAAEGRWAATSIDRFIQGVTLTAGREKEGPRKTRLVTNTTHITPVDALPMADPEEGYTQEQAMNEARRCLQCECLECVKVCKYLERFGGYPKKYAREIYNNDAIVMGSRQANKLVNSCSLCGLCEVVCPENFAVQDLCLAARQGMVLRDKMPPSAHDFFLQDMAFSQGTQYALARHAPGRSDSRYLFFPGCQLGASAPDKVRQVYDHLRERLPGGVGLMLGCCGAPAHWAGQAGLFREEMDRFEATWDALGQPELITACASCYQVFTEHSPCTPILSLWQALEKTGLPPSDDSARSEPVAVHDPCTARHFPETQELVRRLLTHRGVLFEELSLGREKTECCGFGGLMQGSNPSLARDVVRERAQRSPRDYLTYCAMCRDNLAAEGKRALHLLDLFFVDPGDLDPAARQRPDWSQRRENRARLRERMVTELWKEGPAPMEHHSNVQLIVSPEVRERLDLRRILVEDIRQVIAHAEETGEKLVHSETGYFKAFFTPHTVTFWVEYSPDSEGYTVHNAYAHRMEVIGP